MGAVLVIVIHDPAVAARIDRQWSIDHGKRFVDTITGTAP
jgi:predicted ABC-type transport system involved in lysophospholipase L1 biosynthesis ATPase subunit